MTVNDTSWWIGIGPISIRSAETNMREATDHRSPITAIDHGSIGHRLSNLAPDPNSKVSRQSFGFVSRSALLSLDLPDDLRR